MLSHRRFRPLPAVALARAASTGIALIAHPALAGDDARSEAGAALFEENCVACHGADAKGEDGAGGDIRGVIVRQVVMATGGGYEDMPEIELTDDEIEAIVAYLASL